MKRILCVLLVLVMQFTISGCAAEDVDKTILIGVMDTLPVYNSDPSYINGITMAIEDANALYGGDGYSVSYEFYDDESDFQTGISIANNLAGDDRITAVLGTSSLNILDAAADILDTAGKVLVTYYGSNESVYENGYTHVFRNTFGSSDQGKAIADFAASTGEMRRVAVYHSGTGYEKELVRAFMREASSAGLEVADVSTTTSLPADLDELLEKWSLLDVDTVLISQYFAEHAFDMLRRVRTMKADMHVLGDFSFDYVGNLTDNIDVSDEIYIASLLSVEDSSETEAFYQRYRQKFGEECSHWAVQMYDSVRMVVDTAVRIGSTDSGQIALALHADGYEGVGGKRTFDAAGRMLDAPMQIMVSQNGSFVGVTEKEAAE